MKNWSKKAHYSKLDLIVHIHLLNKQAKTASNICSGKVCVLSDQGCMRYILFIAQDYK